MRFPSQHTQEAAETYWNAIRAGNPTHVRMTFSAQGIILTEQDIDSSKGIVITESFNTEDNIHAGKSVSKQFVATVIITTRTENIKWKDRFKLEFGVEINGTTSWITYGYFNGQIPKVIGGENIVEYVAYDDLYKLDVQKIKSVKKALGIKETYSSYDLVGAIFKCAGIFKPDTVYYPTYGRPFTFTRKSILNEFKTLRDVMEKIAENSCCYVICDEDGMGRLTWFGDRNKGTNDTQIYLTISQSDQFGITYEDLYRQSGLLWRDIATDKWKKFNQTTWEFMSGIIADNSVGCVYVLSEDEEEGDLIIDGFAQESVTTRAYAIVDNVFSSSVDDPEEVAQESLDKLVSLGSIVPMELQCIGNWMLEAGDIVDVQVSEDRTVRVPIIYRTFTWAGSCNDVIETAPVLITAEYESLWD